MTARSRLTNNDLSVSGTRYQIYVGTRTEAGIMRDRWSCIDTIGQRTVDNPLDLVSESTSWPLLNGEYRLNGQLREAYTNCPITYRAAFGPSPSDHLQLTGPEIQAAVATAAIRSNPGKAHISVPTFIGELRDFPEMVWAYHWPRLARAAKQLIREGFRRDVSLMGLLRFVYGPKWRKLLDQQASTLPSLGKRLVRKSANTNLWWRFGVAPFISDLLKIQSFAEAVERRFKLLVILRDKGTLRKHVKLAPDAYVGTETSNVMLHSITSASVVRGSILDYWLADRWVSIQWALDESCSLPASTHRLRLLTERILSGLTIGELVRTAWALKPWSWLVDWFVDVDAFLQQHTNNLPVHVTRACFMQTTTAFKRIRVTSSPTWLTLTYPRGYYGSRSVMKYRLPVAGYLAALPILTTVPAISAGQWTILASLAAVRVK